MEKKGGSSMSKWKINAMSAYVNSITPRDQRQAAGIGHDERLVLVPHPPPEDCIDLDDPPVQLPNKLSESGEAESDNPFTSTPSEKAPEQDGTPLDPAPIPSILITSSAAQIHRRARRRRLRCACRAAATVRARWRLRGWRRACACAEGCGSSRTTSSLRPSTESRPVPALQRAPRCSGMA
jgi:hypothetical protein